MFNDIKHSYGKNIYNKLKDISDNNTIVYYIDGQTKDSLREFYKKEMDKVDGKRRILVASYMTLSTGISINQIHNIFFTESFKSEKIIKQTIGRGLRLHKLKKVLYVIDFVDDFSIPGYKNYVLQQSNERKEIYNREKFPYKEYTKKLINNKLF